MFLFCLGIFASWCFGTWAVLNILGTVLPALGVSSDVSIWQAGALALLTYQGWPEYIEVKKDKEGEKPRTNDEKLEAHGFASLCNSFLILVLTWIIF